MRSLIGAYLRSGLLAFPAFALVSCGLVLERLAHGTSVSTGVGSACALVGAAVVSATVPAAEQKRTGLIALHAGCALAAIAMVHAAVVASGPPGLVESARQVVNDIVLIAAVLGFSWAVRLRPAAHRVAVVGGVISCLASYAATRSRWHCDALPSAHSIQQLVIGQALAVALFLLLIDALTPVIDGNTPPW